MEPPAGAAHCRRETAAGAPRDAVAETSDGCDMSVKDRQDKEQGEGDYAAARRYRGDLKDYLKNNDPAPAATEAEAAVKG